MTDESQEATGPATATSSSCKDEQDQVFGRKAEERKKAAEGAGESSTTGQDRPSEPHAGGKA
jgi:hypothetical protein